MSKRPFTKLLKLLIQLHELEDYESPEADALRDEMDEPFHQLNERQSKLSGQVSAELLREKRS